MTRVHRHILDTLSAIDRELSMHGSARFMISNQVLKILDPIDFSMLCNIASWYHNKIDSKASSFDMFLEYLYSLDTPPRVSASIDSLSNIYKWGLVDQSNKILFATHMAIFLEWIVEFSNDYVFNLSILLLALRPTTHGIDAEQCKMNSLGVYSGMLSPGGSYTYTLQNTLGKHSEEELHLFMQSYFRFRVEHLYNESLALRSLAVEYNSSLVYLYDSRQWGAVLDVLDKVRNSLSACFDKSELHETVDELIFLTETRQNCESHTELIEEVLALVMSIINRCKTPLTVRYLFLNFKWSEPNFEYLNRIDA
jgi:hypothetical protein